MSQLTNAVAVYDAAHAAAVSTQAAVAAAVATFLTAMATAVANHNAANVALRSASGLVAGAGGGAPAPAVSLVALGDIQTGVIAEAYQRVANAAQPAAGLTTFAGV